MQGALGIGHGEGWEVSEVLEVWEGLLKNFPTLPSLPTP